VNHQRIEKLASLGDPEAQLLLERIVDRRGLKSPRRWEHQNNYCLRKGGGGYNGNGFGAGDGSWYGDGSYYGGRYGDGHGYGNGNGNGYGNGGGNGDG